MTARMPDLLEDAKRLSEDGNWLIREGERAREVLAELVERLEQAEHTLAYYAERRNHPLVKTNDAYDGQGPGARARACLAAQQREDDE